MTDLGNVTAIGPGANNSLDAAKWLTERHAEFIEVYIVAVPKQGGWGNLQLCAPRNRNGMIIAGQVLHEVAAQFGGWTVSPTAPPPPKGT